jgi:hypothetical protein
MTRYYRTCDNKSRRKYRICDNILWTYLKVLRILLYFREKALGGIITFLIALSYL